MSQIEDQRRRERSVKLCQLTYDRRIDSEICYEIRKILEEGVLIDFQDQNRNKKTALHLAVDKCDETCVRFLLQFRANSEVKDGDGKTPVGLAELKGYQSIQNLLLNSTVSIVNESYVEVFDFERLTRQKIEAVKTRTTFKVLKLINCPSVNEAWNKLDDHDYRTTFSESSHLFLVMIETREPKIGNDQKLMKKVLNLRRPMIVQLNSSSSRDAKIYFKDDSEKFVEIADTSQMTQEEFNEAVRSEDCHMKLLVVALRSNLFGHFTGSILDTKLNANEDRSEAVNQFVKSNALCHRFLKLFDDNPPQIDRLVATLSYKGDQSLLALLDLPFELKDEKLKLTEYQQDILSVVDSSGCNLLMMAVEQKNLGAVKLLIHCGCDFNHADNYDKRASDICWEMKAFDFLSELIEAGSPYPNNFRLDEVDASTEAHERINKMIESINSFHANIEGGKIAEVKKFIASHSLIKHAYDINNMCALTVAIQSNKVEVYSLLMSEGFKPGADDEYGSACIKSSHKNEIRNSHRKYFKEAFNEPHLKLLMKKSRLSFGSTNRAKCSKIIRKMFDKLNEIDEVIPVLKICSLSDKLRIVFDFNCDSVRDLDPTKESDSLGTTYPSDGFIYIGAKNHETEFHEVIGTLIHELTHYAMKLTYENSCKPYKVGDIASTDRFETISTETKKVCDGNSSTDSIVTTVFNCYSAVFWHQELIVRVPQLLAHHKLNPQTLKTAERNTPELFHFYREKTLKDIKTQSRVLLQEYLIRKINNQTGIARKIGNMNIKFERVEINLKPTAYVITSNAPQLTLAMLSQFYSDNFHIFVSLEQVAIGNVLDKIAKVNLRESSTTLIIDCIGLSQKYQASLRKLLKDIKNMKTMILIMTEAESSKAKENFPKVEFKTFDHKWVELTESSKVHLLDQNVNFQGVEIKLKELVEPSSEAMNFFPLGELVDCKDFRIGHELHEPLHKFYIPRQFIKKGQADVKSFEELSQNDIKMNAMIISDDAGSGKSVTLFEVAKSLHAAFPDRWILFVDLKRHIEAFKGVEDHEKIKTFEDFIVQNILKSETKFDQELFEQMFRNGKTLVLFDGFDEISPNYKDLLLHVFKLFMPQTSNQLYITTRPHLESDLVNALGHFVFKLEEFSNESQTSFLRKYWSSVSFKSNEDLEVLSKRLLQKFSQIPTLNFVGLPLLMRMTAEIFNDPIKENSFHKVDSLNVASIFREFVDKYLERWKETGNEISLKENVEIDRDGGILEIHHNIAIKHKFGDKFMDFEVDESNAEKIARVGLIRFDKIKKTFQFIHETFAEYFAADFICFHLKRKNRNPSHDCRAAIEICFEVLSSQFLSFDNFGVILTFLDQTIETTKLSLNEAACQYVAKCVSEVVKGRIWFDILTASLFNKRGLGSGIGVKDNIIIMLLSLAKYVDEDVLLEMLKPRDHYEGDTALRNAVTYRTSNVVSTLCTLITTRIGSATTIFRQRNSNFENILFSATRNTNNGVLTALCQSLNTVLTSDEIKIMFRQKRGRVCIVCFAADQSSDEVFNELLSLLFDYFSKDELKSFVLTSDEVNRNCVQRATAQCTKANVKRQIDFAKIIFDTIEQRTLFYLPWKEQRNIFHLAAQNRNEKIFLSVIESTCDVLSHDDFKFMLMEKDSDESNVLHIATQHGNLNTLNDLNSLLRERLSDGEIKSLLLQVNEMGGNCFRLAANNTNLNFQVFLETIGNLLPLEDQTRLLQESSREINIFQLAAGVNITGEDVPDDTIKFLLTKRNEFGRNVFQETAFDCNVQRWHQLVASAQSRFSVNEVRSLLFDCTMEGENCFLLAVHHSYGKSICEAVCETFKRVFSIEDQKIIVQQKYSEVQRNVFHRAAKNFGKLKYVIEYLSAILSRDEIKAMLMQIDFYGKNVLSHSLTDEDCVEALNKLITFLQEILSPDEIRTLLLDEDYEEQNCFQYLVGSKFSKSNAIRSLSNFIKTILNHDDQRKVFGTKNYNLFRLAVESLNSKIFSTIHECLQSVFASHEIKLMIQERDLNGNSILHLICQQDWRNNSNRDLEEFYFVESLLLDFFKVIKVVCDAQELKEFLTSSNKDDRNCLLTAVKFRDKFFLKELFEIIRTELSIDQQRNMIRKHDSDSNNAFKCASQNRNAEILSFVKELAKDILSNVQYTMLDNKFTIDEDEEDKTDNDAESSNCTTDEEL